MYYCWKIDGIGFRFGIGGNLITTSKTAVYKGEKKKEKTKVVEKKDHHKPPMGVCTTAHVSVCIVGRICNIVNFHGFIFYITLNIYYLGFFYEHYYLGFWLLLLVIIIMRVFYPLVSTVSSMFICIYYNLKVYNIWTRCLGLRLERDMSLPMNNI